MAPRAKPQDDQRPGNALLITSMSIGAVLVLAALGAALAAPKSGDSLAWAMRAVMALGGALLANGFLGFIQLSGKIAGLTVRAGGPMAVFVLLLWVDLPDAVAKTQIEEKTKVAAGETASAQRALRDMKVTLVEPDGTKRTVPGEDAAKELIHRVAGSGPQYLSRSASREQILAINKQLLAARVDQKIVLPPQPR